jgi:hypothetical protein
LLLQIFKASDFFSNSCFFQPRGSAANDAASLYVSLVKEYISGVPEISGCGDRGCRLRHGGHLKSDSATVGDYQTRRLIDGRVFYAFNFVPWWACFVGLPIIAAGV